VKGDVLIKIKVSYYTLDCDGMPEGRQIYEQVEINPNSSDGVSVLVKEALSLKLNTNKDKLKIMRMT
jgi:hypothetical protein